MNEFYLVKTSENNYKIENRGNSKLMVSWDYRWIQERIKTMKVGEEIKLEL